MDSLNVIALILLLSVPTLAKEEVHKISPLKLVKGVRMELEEKRGTSCEGPLSGDSSFDRAACMVRSSSHRASKLRSHLVKGAGVAADYVSPIASGGGDYVTTLTVGTPGKTFPVIADTGSDLIWIQCKPCDQCFDQSDPIFDPKSSSTYESRACSDSLCNALPKKSCSSNVDTCTYAYGYGDGSGTRGSLGSEAVTLESTDGDTATVQHVAFGCGHRNSGKFSGAAGLMGLGRGPLSFVSQLGGRFGNKFSYCLVPWSDSPNVTSPLIFGDSDSDSNSDNGIFRYTPMVRNPSMPTFYYVKLKDISVAGRKLGIPNGTFDIQGDGSGGLIFDSGTTLTMLPQAAYSRLVRSLGSRISLPKVDGSSIGLDPCYDISKAGSNYKSKFPSLVFHFDGADQKLPVDNYFIVVNDAKTVVCFTMTRSDLDIGIIGNLQQQNFRVEYDNDAEKLGWKPAKCDQA